MNSLPERLRNSSANAAQASDKGSNASSKSEIDQSKPASNQIDQSKPASIAALADFAKFVLARIIRQGDEVVVTLTAAEEVKAFNRLANRVRLVLGLDVAKT